ncbi:hypothetical protein C6495_13730 [Candidatus Poribacteria bacterium]|nr:MAG: hypothetical protein C6495_13730 [Candidatus Poribacteria bacterium]
MCPNAAAENVLSRWDKAVFDSIYDAPPRREPLWTLMEGITEFGHYRAVMGVSMLLMAYGNPEHRETGRLLTSAFLATGTMTYGMKHLVGRKRPLDETLGNPAFPSGHTSLAFTSATILGYRYPRWRVPLYVGAGFVGFSRIYLGRHYASDVIVGAALGTAVGVLVWHNAPMLLRWEF